MVLNTLSQALMNFARFRPVFGRPIEPGDGTPSTFELQLHTVAGNAVAIGASGTLIATTVVAAFWGTVPAWLLASWAVLAIGASLTPPWLLHNIGARVLNDDEAKRVIDLVFVVTVVRGLVWGGGAAAFYQYASESQLTLLGEAAAQFKDAYDVAPSGNWEGHTILNRSKRMLLGSASHEAALAQARKILFDARTKRIPPGRDDKVLADWNGMMIAALARAGFAFDRADWIDLAKRALAGVRQVMTGPDGRLRHSFRKGRLQHAATIDDHANVARAAMTYPC